MKRALVISGLVAGMAILACGNPSPPGVEVEVAPGVVHADGVIPGSTVTLYTASSTRGGYDFVAGTYQGTTGGDLYYAKGKFFADSPGQRGVIDVGACASPSSVTTMPPGGYVQSGVAVTNGHCYVVLSHGDVRDYGVLRVSKRSADLVTFDYNLVTTSDFGATLIAGDAFKGGYDFLSNAYRGLSGGDLYFAQGAFWANNYDERGVASVGACAYVDDVKSVPKLSFSRQGVAATVGNCYVSPLHANNRSYSVFRVDAITSTTVTLTWRLVPVPVDQLAWQHCENWRNYAAVAPTTTASTLTSWLAANPSLKDSMQWISTVVPDLPAVTVGYDQWPASMQQALQDNFVAYWAWYAGGMTGADPTPVNDPPTNLLPTDPTTTLTVISESDAQALYVKYLALTFVVELQHQVPWSILEYDAASLAELLDARKFYTSWTGTGYSLIDRTIIPAPPLVSAAFVAQHNFLCTDRPKTIAEAVFWTRNLKHFDGEGSDAAAEIAYWQYAGNPPASRVLSGTHYNGINNSWVPTNLIQWTFGCHGTTGLLKSLLRTLNIPVEHFDFYNKTITVTGNSLTYGHAVPHFIADHLWMSHADDPYQNTFWMNILPFPIQAFLIDDAQYFAWYPNNAPANVTVGQNMNLIWATYGDTVMLSDRLTDLTTNPTPPDANICSYVTPTVANSYTCSQAESMGLLGMLDPLLTPYVSSGQAALQNDENNLPYYYFPEVQFRPAPCDQTCMSNVCAQNSACCTQWSWSCSQISNTLCGTLCSWPP